MDSVSPSEKFCVVCGAGSHRLDWQDKKNPSCDSHSQAEVMKAVSAKTPVIVSPPPAVPVGPPQATPPVAVK